MLPQPFSASDTAGLYHVDQSVSAQQILQMANYISRQNLKCGTKISSPDKSYRYLQSIMQSLKHELFSVLFLNQQHQILKFEEMFRGTVHSASIYPREIAKLALELNATSVILVHNHPSGCLTPSQSDIDLTKQVERSLDLLDIRTLDHLIVSTEGYTSLRELGHY